MDNIDQKVEQQVEVIEPERDLMESFGEDDFVKRFEKQVTNYRKFQSACFRLTNETHWANLGTASKPSLYLEAPGAEALMTPLGISYGEPQMLRIDKSDREGDYYIIQFKGEAESRLLGRRGFALGFATSRDQFFAAQKNWDGEVSEGDVIKKAYSNWEVNIVGRLAGIRRPSPEMLTAAGLDLNKIGRVAWGNSSEEKGGQVITEGQAKRLYAIARDIDQARVKSYLRFCGYESSKDILRRDYDSIIAWAEKGGPDWEAKKPEQPAAKQAGPTPGEEKIKNLKEQTKEAPPPPAEVEKISAEQMKQLQEEAKKADISEAGLQDFLKTEWGCLLRSLPAAHFGPIRHAIMSGEVKGWIELGSAPAEDETEDETHA